MTAVADPDLEVRGEGGRRRGGVFKKDCQSDVSVCLSHVGLGFRPKLGGGPPSLEPPLLCKHMCPTMACLVIFFVAVLFLCPVLLPFCLIPVWQCNHAEESHTC